MDPTVTITRIYSLFYWCINVGALAALITTQLERRIGFWAAFSLPTVTFLGTPVDSHLGAESVLQSTSQRQHYPGRHQSVAHSRIYSWRRYRGLHPKNAVDIWDLAKPSFALRSSWFTWDDDFVDDVQQTLRACQVAAFLPIYWSANLQLGTNLVSMASTLRDGRNPQRFIAEPQPVLPHLSYPSIRHGNISKFKEAWLRCTTGPIPRITLGFFIAATAMVYAAVLQSRIYGSNACGEYVSDCRTKSSISVWAQAPCYVRVALFFIL